MSISSIRTASIPKRRSRKRWARSIHAVRQGKALYAGISSYNSQRTKEAVAILRRLGTPCLIHQPSYSMINRWIEDDHLLDTLDAEGVGAIVFSPLAQGLLTDKYLKGVPVGSRAAENRFLKQAMLTPDNLERTCQLDAIARRRGQTLAQMALAWTLRDKRVTSALIGASSPEQVADSVKALDNLSFTARRTEGNRPPCRGRRRQPLAQIRRARRLNRQGRIAGHSAVRDDRVEQAKGRNRMLKRPRIGVIGSTNMDLTTTVERMPVWGETVLARRFETSFGGKGANQAVAAAKLGAEVVMVTNLGDDTLGASALENFESYGIDTRHVRRIPNQSTGTATILVDAGSGDNAILIVAGANGDLSSADVDAAGEALKGCDLILLQLEIQLETAYAAIRFARKNGVRTVLNPAPARAQPRHGRYRAGELPHPQRDRARDHDRHAGGVGRRGLSRRAKPRRAEGSRRSS